MNNDSKLEIAYKYCKPLKVACIKNELETQLEGYIFQCIERENDKWIVCFENFSRGRAYLTISLDSFWVLKTTANGIERINLDENLLLTHRLLDKRENGVVYSIIQKQFAYSLRYKYLE